jgi:prepilin-type N-terminal cleavage/methylation domain-containing protein
MKSFNHKKTTAASFSRKAGFTLVEMMVAVFVFSVVMVLSTGAIFSIIAANKTSQAVKSVMDNLSSALDSMSREIRYGTVYNCNDSAPNFTTPASCTGSDFFSFVARPTDTYINGEHIIYTFALDAGSDTAGYINKCTVGTGGASDCIRLTAQEVHVTRLNFYVKGASRNESSQPEVLMTISGYAQAGPTQSTFNIETLVSQRSPDMCKDIIPATFKTGTTCS